MKQILITTLTLVFITTGCSYFEKDNLPNGFYSLGGDSKVELNGVESKIIEFYPTELDSIIDIKLAELKSNDKYEKMDVIVYHAAVVSRTEKGGETIVHEPYVDTTRYAVNVKLKTTDGEEEWVFDFDLDLNYLWGMKRKSTSYSDLRNKQ